MEGNSAKLIENILGTSCGTSSEFNQWSMPVLIRTEDIGKSIEMIYKQFKILTLTNFGYQTQSEERVFKIVYSCKYGKWNKSEPIFGRIVPAHEEYYEFNEE